jgi:integrase
MSNSLSRAQGLEQGRLPNYVDTYNEAASKSEGAKRFRISMCNFAIQHAGKRVDGDIASFKTIGASKDALGGMATTLWGLGYQLTNPEGFSEKHARALIRHKWAYGISPGGLSVLMTQLSKLQTWIKKTGMLKTTAVYLPEVDPAAFKRRKIAEHSKSVSGNGYDLGTVVSNADYIDWRFGAMVRIEAIFGLRREEALKIIPHLDDKGRYFDIRKGVAKSGLERKIPIETPLQRQTLDYVKSLIPKREHLGWMDKPKQPKGKSSSSSSQSEMRKQLLKRNEGRYNANMIKLGFTKKDAGVTGHGLRVEYSEDMALMKGFVPATLGGTKGQLDQESLDLARLQVAESMGHSRISVTGAYYGSLKAKMLNSLGQKVGTIRLDENRVATVFVNPPLIAQPSGAYATLTTRKLANTDITAVIEDISDGIGVEVAQIDVKKMHMQSEYQSSGIALDDVECLKRLSSKLLLGFGIRLQMGIAHI